MEEKRIVNFKFEISFDIGNIPAANWPKHIMEKMKKLGFEVSEPFDFFAQNGNSPFLAFYPEDNAPQQ